MSENSKETYQITSTTTSLVAVAQTALGCGIGLVLAERLGKDARKTATIALFVTGAAALIAVTTGIVTDLVAGPRSKFGAHKRLESIRGDGGLGDTEDIF